MSRNRREVLRGIGSTALGGLGLHITSVEVAADSDEVNTGVGQFVEFSLEVPRQPSANELHTCTDLSAFSTDGDEKGRKRVVFSRFHSEDLQGKPSSPVSMSHQGPFVSNHIEGSALGPATTSSTPGAGGTVLQGYRFQDPVEFSTSGAVVSATVGDSTTRVRPNETASTSTDVQIRSEDRKSTVSADLSVHNHGNVTFVTHPSQLIMPQNETTSKVVDELSANAESNRRSAKAKAVVYPDSAVVGIDRGGANE